MPDPEDVLRFWLDEVGPDGWYAPSDALDETIRERFGGASRKAAAGDLDAWAETGRGALALMVLLDQMPRNMHRGSAEAFAADGKARELARAAIARDLDLETEVPGRQFFYLPFEHAEDLADHDWCIALMRHRLGLDEQLLHARAHREVIARFGRFPFRNEALGRATTGEEAAWLEEGGYPALVATLRR